MLKGVNWIAVIAALVLLEVAGFLYYAVILKDAWIAALGTPPEPKSVGFAQGLGMGDTLIIVLGLAWLQRRLGARSLGAMLGVALAAWLFFDFTTMAIDYLFVGQRGALVAINMGYQLLAYALAGLTLGALPPRA
ncbi:DUF1761 domain-containing protein [Phenylobacterium montanum]|uniref:DUF1761 domain-containing protein n=1 Tax=Phenylobacterium montanum TaxID=2823693 RepID=A0A975FYV7_9CAUL|nr:DUF1761 domain-containing protein [Caulobacter sp. S6]QUD87950.1 DUF1761 domain-containing protein [Caulobacter sp. S6]